MQYSDLILGMAAEIACKTQTDRPLMDLLNIWARPLQFKRYSFPESGFSIKYKSVQARVSEGCGHHDTAYGYLGASAGSYGIRGDELCFSNAFFATPRL